MVVPSLWPVPAPALAPGGGRPNQPQLSPGQPEHGGGRLAEHRLCFSLAKRSMGEGGWGNAPPPPLPELVPWWTMKDCGGMCSHPLHPHCVQACGCHSSGLLHPYFLLWSLEGTCFRLAITSLDRDLCLSPSRTGPSLLCDIPSMRGCLNRLASELCFLLRGDEQQNCQQL